MGSSGEGGGGSGEEWSSFFLTIFSFSELASAT